MIPDSYRRSVLDEKAIQRYAQIVAAETQKPFDYEVVANNGSFAGWFLTDRKRNTSSSVIDNHFHGYIDKSYKRYTYFLSSDGKLLYSCETYHYREEHNNEVTVKKVPKKITVYVMSADDFLIFDAPKIIENDGEGNYDDFIVDWGNIKYGQKGIGLSIALQEIHGKYSFNPATVRADVSDYGKYIGQLIINNGVMKMEYNTVNGINNGNNGGQNNVVINNVENDLGQFMMALANIREAAVALPNEERQEVIECVEAITDEVKSPQPKKTVVRRLLDGIKTVTSNEIVKRLAITAGELWLKSKFGG